MNNIRIYDNGNAYIIMVDGLTVHACSSLGDAWRHIQWMHDVATQQFTVGDKEIPVEEWLTHMIALGFLEH